MFSSTAKTELTPATANGFTRPVEVAQVRSVLDGQRGKHPHVENDAGYVRMIRSLG